jgi:hypothetical protein
MSAISKTAYFLFLWDFVKYFYTNPEEGLDLENTKKRIKDEHNIC